VETPLCQTQRLPLNFHRVLQCVAVCCSVLQRIAVCCSVLQCVAVCCSVSQCVAGLCHSVLEMCCSALQGAATRFSYTHLPSPTFAYGEGCGKEVIWQRRWLYCSLCQVFFFQDLLPSPTFTTQKWFCDIEMSHHPRSDMGRLRSVGSLKLQVSFVKEPYKSDGILQKRPIILRSLLIVATPYHTILDWRCHYKWQWIV